jgi:WD40 repeat protein
MQTFCQFLGLPFQIWNLGSPDPNFTLDAHLKGVNCVDYFTGGDRPFLITGSDDNTAKVCIWFRVVNITNL